MIDEKIAYNEEADKGFFQGYYAGIEWARNLIEFMHSNNPDICAADLASLLSTLCENEIVFVEDAVKCSHEVGRRWKEPPELGDTPAAMLAAHKRAYDVAVPPVPSSASDDFVLVERLPIIVENH